MTLGRLIYELKQRPQNQQVRFDFCELVVATRLMSWRGDYSHLSIGYSLKGEITTVAELLSACESAIGRKFTGYKGGDFLMDEATMMHVDNWGACSKTSIYGVKGDDLGTYTYLLTHSEV